MEGCEFSNILYIQEHGLSVTNGPKTWLKCFQLFNGQPMQLGDTLILNKVGVEFQREDSFT
jgi:hypothetical protein